MTRYKQCQFKGGLSLKITNIYSSFLQSIMMKFALVKIKTTELDPIA